MSKEGAGYSDKDLLSKVFFELGQPGVRKARGQGSTVPQHKGPDP